MKSSFRFMVYGFAAGETSMQSLLARKPEVNASALVNAMFEAMVEVRADPEPSGKSLAISVVGYSDRDQTPGRSEDGRRANEDTNATARATSFVEWMRAVMAFRLGVAAEGLSFGDHVHVLSLGAGASQLEAPSTSEENRQRNRRIEIAVQAANVPAVAAKDTQWEML